MKLEIGKRYITRDGRTSTLLTPCEDDVFKFEGRLQPHGKPQWERRTWKENGRYTTGDECCDDLVAEYVEPPCTETSNEVWGCRYTEEGKVNITAGFVEKEAKGYAGEYKFIPGDPTFPAYQFTGKIGIPGDPETDLREAIEVIRKQHAEIQAYRTILKELL